MIPFRGWPREPFKGLNEPIKSLVGKYEAGLHRDGTHSRNTLAWMCDAIEGFFYDHPKVKRPEQILITDVEDWRLAKLQDYSWNVVRRDLGALRAFYNWLRRDGDYPNLDNPVFVPPPRPDSRPQ